MNRKLLLWILGVILVCVVGLFLKKIYKKSQLQQNVSVEMLPKSVKIRFFSMDLHIAVIEDLRNLFDELGGYEVHNWNLSGHGWVLGKKQDNVEIVNSKTWHNLDQEMVDKFYDKYKDYLNQFDAFIVTHNASFALLYEKFNKPIIIVNSTRYENPFTNDPIKWKWLDDYLKKGVAEGRIFIVSNNKGDQNYLEYFTGLKSEHIPSMCLYTQAKYRGIKDGFILNAHNKQEVLANISPTNASLIQNEKLEKKYKWQDLYDFKGIVHFPYQISTMSIFEQYSANVPLFFPTKEFLLNLHGMYPKHILSELSFYQVSNLPSSDMLGNPNNTNDSKVLQEWAAAADFYDVKNMPYIQYFDSFKHLENLLKSVNLQEISSNMEQYNIKRKADAVERWKRLLQDVEKKIR